MKSAGLVLSAAELASFNVSGLPGTIQGIMDRAKGECWPFVATSGRGGGSGKIKLYAVPKYVEAAIALKRDKEIRARLDLENAQHENDGHTPQMAVTQTALAGVAPPPAALTERQRQIAEARASILLHVLQLAQSGGIDRAMYQVAEAAAARTLPPALAPLVAIANARAGASRTLTRATLYRWMSLFDPERPRAVDGLAPRNSGQTKRAKWLRKTADAWAEAALRLYQRPQKPTIRWVHEELPKHLPPSVKAPSYDSLRRFFASMGNVAIHAGRMGPRAIKAITPFIRRDKGDLWPGEVMMADGHQFDAEVAHPRHGGPFRPELTGVLCAGTRRLLGWSIDLAESGLAVLDALRVATMNSHMGEIFYVDWGSGYRNAMISAPGVGLLTRLGMTLKHSIPYNSQARGVMERLHKSIWVRAAKELPTYMGRDMDPEAGHKVHKLTRKDIKDFGHSRRLMPWADFLRFAADHAERYNNHPHRGLPKIDDPETGKPRHMTPNEAWAAAMQDAEQQGRVMPTLDTAEADHLFRPQTARRVIRGEIRLFGNTYFSPELTEHHGDGVNVGYDIHDPSQVWVHDADGVLLCKAELDGNKRPMFSDSVRAEAHSVSQRNSIQRAKGREKRLQDQLDEVRRELHGGPLVLENDPTPRAGFVADAMAAEVVQAQITAISAPEARAEQSRPLFMTQNARYEWLKGQGHDKWEESDCDFLRKYVQDEDGYALFAERYELLGMGWNDQDRQIVKHALEAARRAA